MKFLSIFLMTISIILSVNFQVHGETLKCDYKFDYFAGWVYYYGCIVQNKEIFNGNRVTIEKIEGEHKGHSTNRGVEAFQLEDAENLKYFPIGLNNFFPYLKSIQISSSKLVEIKYDDLKNFPHLEYLDLRFNKITEIDENTFKNNQKLEYIDLSYNKIKNVNQKAFHNLQNLKTLSLKRNQIEIITEELLSENPNLEDFNIRNNKIKAINANAFDNLQLLRSLDLSENICELLNAASKIEVQFVIKKLKKGQCQI
ncbi:hypothetical protein PVAND_017243 [Polypedilum vanderplanki]|uniref:Leucine rich repeat protein n=1 Tax=Polypedilum vanderplanki TaxID=319348 RepID=A0A9J6BII1_POLVA|nr:hypothetical protein PVAND_017243 [Polypedilum vanderplanki]